MIGEKSVKQYQVADRRVVNTLDDQNKYDISSSRRLRVQANPVNMPLNVRMNSQSSQLLEALGQLRPALLDYASERQSDIWAGEINQGKYMTEEQVKSEWQQYGYDSTKGLLDSEDLASVMEEDWLNTPKEIGEDQYQDFDEWYAKWWQEKGGQYVNGKSLAYMEKFTPMFQKRLVTLKNKHAEEVTNIKTARMEETATEHALRAIQEVRSDEFGGTSVEFNVYNLDVLAKDLRARFPMMEPRRIDELLYGAAKRYAEDTGDYHVLPVFKENHVDGTPGLGSKKVNDTTRFGEQIDNDILAIQDLNYKRMKRTDELQKQAREQAREEIYRNIFTSIEDNDSDAIVERMNELYQKGYFASVTEMNTELNAWLNIKKKAETKEQQLNALNLRIAVNEGKNVSGKELMEALKSEEISYDGAKMVQAELEARNARWQSEARADQREAIKNSRLDKDGLYNRAIQRINAFFPNPTPRNENPEGWYAYEIWRAELVRDFQVKAEALGSPSELFKLADTIIADNRLADPAANEGLPTPANSKRNDPRIIRTGR